MVQEICILTSVHYPYDTRIFNKQAISLAENGYDVTLIAFGSPDSTVETPDGLNITLLQEPSNRISRFTQLPQLARTAIRENADVYHIHDPELLPVIPIIKFTTQASIIYDIHEDIRSQIAKKDWIPKGLKQVTKIGYDLIENICLPLIDEIILAENSYQSRSQYQRGYVIHNYPKIDEYPDKSLSRNAATRLVYIGGLSRPRGINEMIEVIDRISNQYNIKFQFIGEFSSESLRKEVINEIENRNIESAVEFTGRLPFNEAINQVAEADIGFATLHKEPNFVGSLPTKLFEYMMCSVSVIISDVEQWERIVSENECGIAVSPTNISEIVKATEYLIENENKRKKMGQNGRAAVEAKYSWSAEEKKLLQIYEDICSKVD